MSVDVQAIHEVITIITGGWRAQSLYTAVKLGLPDLIESGRNTPPTMAEACGANEDGIRRLMRLLVAMELFEGTESTGYRNTPASSTLLEGTPSLRDLCLLYGEEFYSAWGHAHHAISTAGSGFELAYGQPLYSYLSQEPATASRFQKTMNAGSMFFDAVPKVLDFSGKRVVDVGGGGGDLLATILRAVPDSHGTLFDREHMIPKASEHLSSEVGLDRVDLVGGDMFVSVPPGGDVYILSRVLAGWSDEDVIKAFVNCRNALQGSDGRILLLDRFVRDEDPTVLPALWDLHLMVTTGGKHRTLNSITALLNQAGLQIVEMADLPMETTALVVAPH